MNSIFGFLSAYMNHVIIILGIVLFILLIGNYLRLVNHHNQINSALNWNNTKTVLNKITGELEDKTNSENVTPDTIREMQTGFNKTCAWHEAFSQLISLFPLFGILGTVAGLILQLRSGDFDQIFSALNLALDSTFYGIVFAIVLKLFDSLFPARSINETEIDLENYDKKINNAVMLGNITE